MTSEKRLAVILTVILVFGASSLAMLFVLVRSVSRGIEPNPVGESEGRADPGARRARGSTRLHPAALLIDENQLESFLEVRRRLHDVYGREDLVALLADTTVAADRAALADRLEGALNDALTETGLGLRDYHRISRVVYDTWWRATGGGVNVFDRLRQAKRELDELDETLRTARLEAEAAARLRARRMLLQREIERLEWSRSYEAYQTRERVPDATRRACEARAAEINRYAMPELAAVASS